MHFCPDPVPASSGCTNYIHSLLPMFPNYSVVLRSPNAHSFYLLWFIMMICVLLFISCCPVLFSTLETMQPVSPSVYYMLHVFLQTLHLHMTLLHILYTHTHTIFFSKNTCSAAFQKKVSHNCATYLMEQLSPWEHSYDAFEWFWNRGLVLVQPTQQNNETRIHLFFHPHRADIRTTVVMSCSQNAFVLI